MAHLFAGRRPGEGVQRRDHRSRRRLRGRRADAGRHRLRRVDVQRFDHRDLIARLRTLAFYGVSIGAVCTGTHVLAKAGLLDGRKCTIHWENLDSFKEEFGEIEVTQELFEIDRNRFTCAGGTAAIDMMLSMIAKQKGQDIAAMVTDQLIHHRIRDANERQRMELRRASTSPTPSCLRSSRRWRRAWRRRWSCSELAARVELSTRQLERLFRRYRRRADKILSWTAAQSLTLFAAADLDAHPHHRSGLRLCVGVAFFQVLQRVFWRTPSQERRQVA
jgi:hypothetical protein